MFDFRAVTMSIQRLIESIRNIPGAILRLLRAIFVPMVLRGSSVVSKILHPVRPNSPASSTSLHTEGEPSWRGASYSVVAASSAPASSTASLRPRPHDDSANNLSPSMHGYTPCATPVTTLDAKFKPAAPEQIQRHLRRKLTYVSVHVFYNSHSSPSLKCFFSFLSSVKRERGQSTNHQRREN